MLAAERQERICDTVTRVRAVSTEQLARDLGVSAETVRRDLVLLEDQGLIRRVHGGAASRPTFAGAEPAYEDRAGLDTEAKVSMARIAAGLVSRDQTLVLDVGTSVLEVARALPMDFVGTVATCSLVVAGEVATRPGVEVLVSGGRLRRGDLALSNAQTLSFFADLRPDIAFLGSGGVDVVAGLTDFHVDEVASRRVIAANAARSYVLADNSKLGRVAPHRVCRIDEIAAVITDRKPQATLRDALSQTGVEVLCP